MIYLVSVKYYSIHSHHFCIDSFNVEYDKKITYENFKDFEGVVTNQLNEITPDVASDYPPRVLSFSKLEEN